MLRAIILDIGGVLEITPDPQMRGLFARWEERLQLQPGEFATRLGPLNDSGSLGTCTEADWWRDFRTALGLSSEAREAFQADFWAEYLGELNVDLVRYITHLRSHYKIALLSNSFLGAREREQARYQFQDLAEVIIYSHEVGWQKPDPRIYQLTCERLALPPQATVFLDDREPNIIAARQLGMQGILFVNTQQAIAEIEAWRALEDSPPH